ncbi:hypothetical protein GMD74_07980 [Parabacteroides merdae]|nr:hypothetical protein [Parabacteroides merdae]
MKQRKKIPKKKPYSADGVRRPGKFSVLREEMQMLPGQYNTGYLPSRTTNRNTKRENNRYPFLPSSSDAPSSGNRTRREGLFGWRQQTMNGANADRLSRTDECRKAERRLCLVKG